MDWLDEQIKKSFNQQLNSIKDRVREIFKEALNQDIYNRRNPSEYDRTYQLLDAINVEIKDDSLIVFIDSDILNYTSAVDGRSVSSAVPRFLRGHDDSSNIDNWYHHYPKSNYLETAKEMIESELGLRCEIIDEEPPMV